MEQRTVAGISAPLPETADGGANLHKSLIWGSYFLGVGLILYLSWRTTKKLSHWVRVPIRCAVLSFLFSPALIGAAHGAALVPFSLFALTVFDTWNRDAWMYNIRTMAMVWPTITAIRLVGIWLVPEKKTGMA